MTITRKVDIRIETEAALSVYSDRGFGVFVKEIDRKLLQQKIRFPLLEYSAELIFEHLPEKEHYRFCEAIAKLHTIGGNVLIGIVLQKRLNTHLEEVFRKAAQFIETGSEWYVTDIIGERVFGVALLQNPRRSIPLLRKLAKHPSAYVVRSIGPGAHYAIKKGLPEKNVRPVFELLLSLANTRDHQVKQGIGWAAKTTAKFHPAIIEDYRKQIEAEKVGAWFRTKIRIGLERYHHAQRKRS